MIIDTARNLNLHPKFLPRWDVPEFAPQVVVPQGNTSFDPFLGTGWGEALDAMGASDPGGARMGPNALPESPLPASMRGLQSLAKGKK